MNKKFKIRVLLTVTVLFGFYVFSSSVRGKENLYTETEAGSDTAGETLEQMKARIRFDYTWPSEQSKHEYVGVKKCSLCHKAKKQGDQYRIWLGSPHAKAYETLGTPEAKELAGKLGIDDSQKSGKCLRCHSTAYGFGEEKITEVISVEEGISCETCHGPGKDYLTSKIMKNRKKAVAKGLIIGKEQTCLKCHNATAPNVKEFHFEEAFDQMKHPVPR